MRIMYIIPRKREKIYIKTKYKQLKIQQNKIIINVAHLFFYGYY